MPEEKAVASANCSAGPLAVSAMNRCVSFALALLVFGKTLSFGNSAMPFFSVTARASSMLSSVTARIVTPATELASDIFARRMIAVVGVRFCVSR
jgi:hypothetical protein